MTHRKGLFGLNNRPKKPKHIVLIYLFFKFFFLKAAFLFLLKTYDQYDHKLFCSLGKSWIRRREDQQLSCLYSICKVSARRQLMSSVYLSILAQTSVNHKMLVLKVRVN